MLFRMHFVCCPPSLSCLFDAICVYLCVCVYVLWQHYTLTGPAALSCAEVAASLSAEVGRDIHYVDVTMEASKQGMMSMHFPEVMADMMIELYGVLKAGYGSEVTHCVTEITGKPARTIDDYVQSHRDMFAADAVKILVTGPTGNVGRYVMKHLLSQKPKDVCVRVMVRDEKKGAEFASQGAEVAVGDFDNGLRSIGPYVYALL